MRRINVGLLALITVVACGQFAVAGSQFFPPKYYKVGPKNVLANSVITADFNNDGVLDLAVADALSNRISILLGKSDGTFGPPIIFAAPYPLAISAGDMNNDGNQDLVVAEYGGTGTSGVGVFLGDGTGHFREHATYQTGVESFGLTVAKLQGGGNLGVAVANRGNNGQGESMMVFFGDGKGGLGKPTSYPFHLRHGGPTAVVAGDLTGAGTQDLALAVSPASGVGSFVAVFLNDGTGKFMLSGKYPVTGLLIDIKLADLTGSGRLDIAVAGDQALDILLNKGGGKFRKSATYPSCHQCGGPNTIVVADFDLDGIPDVACTGNFAQANSNGIFYGRGGGKFGTEVTIPNVDGGAGITSGNFDRNGSPDLAISIGDNHVGVLLNKK
jgi:hypothetical protein